MEVVQAAERVNINSGDEIEMTENTNMNEALEKIESLGFDSRDRRKSKYLSYPYTNMAPKHRGLPVETEDLRTPCVFHKAETSSKATKPFNGSPSSAKLGSKRFRRNWYRKFVSCSTIPSCPEFINASSDVLLSGLYSKAVDCMFPMKKKSFDLFEWFFCRYRVSEYHDEAELATALVNVNGGNIGKPVGNDLQDIKTEKKKRKYDKMENKVRRKMKSLSGLSDVNISSSTGDSLKPGRKLKQKRKVEEENSLHQLQNVETTLNESSGGYISVPEAPQSLTCFASEEAGTEKRKKEEAGPAYESAQIASVNTDTQSTLVIDLQLASPSMPGCILQNSDGEHKEELVLMRSNSELCVSQEGFVGNITDHGLSVSAISEVGTVLANETGLKGRMEKVEGGHLSTKLATAEGGTVTVNETGPKGRTEKVAERHLSTKHAAEIPDLNGTVSESNSTLTEFENVSILSPEVKSEQSRSLSACVSVRPTKTTSCIRVEDNGEAHGNCLLLRFAPGVYVPSKEDLMAAFFRFGPLKASETKLLKDTASAQIVFVKSTDAREAFRSLQQNNPFGAALVDCKLHHLSAVGPPAEQFMTPTRPTGSMPMPGETHPPLHFIRQNLQMMTSMLENSGNNLSPQMRAKLDSELKNLLKKVNSRAGSSLLKSER